MKKSTLFIALALIGIIFPTILFRTFQLNLPKPVTNLIYGDRSDTISPISQTPAPAPGLPTTIHIPSIGLASAHIEHVGIDDAGRMDVPKVISNTGWYMEGTRPGEKGSAVIDGHYNTPTGAPSVFYNLKNIVVGDIIEIDDSSGKTYRFKVFDVVTYDLATIPMEKIFEKTDEARLNLITCEGTWNTRDKDYSQRVVVYSRLLEG